MNIPGLLKVNQTQKIWDSPLSKRSKIPLIERQLQLEGAIALTPLIPDFPPALQSQRGSVESSLHFFSSTNKRKVNLRCNRVFFLPDINTILLPLAIYGNQIVPSIFNYFEAKPFDKRLALSTNPFIISGNLGFYWQQLQLPFFEVTKL